MKVHPANGADRGPLQKREAATHAEEITAAVDPLQALAVNPEVLPVHQQERPAAIPQRNQLPENGVNNC